MIGPRPDLRCIGLFTEFTHGANAAGSDHETADLASDWKVSASGEQRD